MKERRSNRVTSFDVARRAGVSRSTVSIVINSTPGITISERTRLAVWDAVKELNYYPNTIARSMRSSRSSMLGLVVGIHPTGHFLSNLLAGIQDTVSAAGYSLVLAGTGLDEAKMASYATRYLQRQVDGLIVALYTNRTDSSFLGPLKATGVPIVVVNAGFREEGIGFVHLDHEMGALEATRHLVRLGHSRVGFVARHHENSRPIPAQNLRLQGYLRAMSEAGLEAAVLTAPRGTGPLNRHGGYQVGREILAKPNRPTALYCSSDSVAFGVMDAARELHFSVPQDLAIIGNDDHPGSQVVWPPLSTVGLPHFQAGKEAARMLIEYLGADDETVFDEVLLPCRLILRQTCGTDRTATLTQ